MPSIRKGDRVPEKRLKVQVQGQQGLVDAIEVAVTESTERWTEVRLEDGSLLRIKPVLLSAVRVENQFDQDGNPIYQVKVNQVMTVTDVAEHLRKGASGSPKTH